MLRCKPSPPYKHMLLSKMVTREKRGFLCVRCKLKWPKVAVTLAETPKHLRGFNCGIAHLCMRLLAGSCSSSRAQICMSRGGKSVARLWLEKLEGVQCLGQKETEAGELSTPFKLKGTNSVVLVVEHPRLSTLVLNPRSAIR